MIVNVKYFLHVSFPLAKISRESTNPHSHGVFIVTRMVRTLNPSVGEPSLIFFGHWQYLIAQLQNSNPLIMNIEIIVFFIEILLCYHGHFS